MNLENFLRCFCRLGVIENTLHLILEPKSNHFSVRMLPVSFSQAWYSLRCSAQRPKRHSWRHGSQRLGLLEPGSQLRSDHRASLSR